MEEPSVHDLWLGESPDACDPGDGLLNPDGTLNREALYEHLGLI
ncbi:MAG TPA: hypothetical protein VJJ47_00160 [Candidatus Paceibacterota bacterium]